MSEARIIPLGSKNARIRASGGATERRSRSQGPTEGDHDDSAAASGTDAGGPVGGGRAADHRRAEGSGPDPRRSDPPTSATAVPTETRTAAERSGGQRWGDAGPPSGRDSARRAPARPDSARPDSADVTGPGGAGERGPAVSRESRASWESPGPGEFLTPEAGDTWASKERAGVFGLNAPADDVGAGPASVLPSEPLANAGSLERALAGFLAFLRRRITGDYVVDEHGFDPDLTENVIAPLLRPVYQNYFRVETRGLENVPDTGGALIVANHSGALPLDAIMTSLAIMDHHPAHRHLRILAADLVFSVPFLAPLARKTGNTLACQADAERLLAGGHLVGVWPEGFKGIGKPFSERYKLQRFGRGGFVSAALRTGVPIIPCTIVGAEEIYPMIGNFRTLARLLGLPYLPVTPTFPWLGLLGLVPLPSKWFIEFGEPVETESPNPAAAEDPMLVFELTDRIRETIQHSLYGLLMQRRSVFF
nr:lysophospholipid acyltransferase family protein [Protofrankia sp. BMG5.30]